MKAKEALARKVGIVGMYAEGFSYAEIGRKFKISRQRVQQIVRPPADVAEMVIRRAKGRCERCGVRVRSGHIHPPESDGEALAAIWQLMYLCPSCHRIVHLESEANKLPAWLDD